MTEPEPPVTPPDTLTPGWLIPADGSGSGLALRGINPASLPLYTGSNTIAAGATVSDVRIELGSTNRLVLGNGATVERCQIVGTITQLVRLGATGCTLRDVDIISTLGPATSERIVVISDGQGAGHLLDNVKVRGGTVSLWIDGPQNPAAAANTLRGVHVLDQQDKAASGNTAHWDGLTRRQGTNPLVVEGCRFFCDQTNPDTTGAVFLQPTYGAVAGLDLRDSMLEGYGYCLAVEGTGQHRAVGNRFRALGYGAVTAQAAVTWSTWSDNTAWADNAGAGYRGAVIGEP